MFNLESVQSAIKISTKLALKLLKITFLKTNLNLFTTSEQVNFFFHSMDF